MLFLKRYLGLLAQLTPNSYSNKLIIINAFSSVKRKIITSFFNITESVEFISYNIIEMSKVNVHCPSKHSFPYILKKGISMDNFERISLHS